MSKVLKNSDLSERPAIRTLLAVSLCASIAAFGCTTDRTVGNGDPVVTPGVRTSPTGGASTGTETESTPPPMMSSYSGAQALPAVRPRTARMSREEAALLLTELQPRVRVLGPVAPGNGGRGYSVDPQLIANAQRVGQRSTINSTIYSAPGEAVISGAGEASGGGDAATTFLDTVGVDATGVAGGVTSAGTVAGTSAVAGSTVTNGATAIDAGTTVTSAAGTTIAPTTAATATPTGSAIGVPSALASVRTLSPTAAAVVNPPASISGSPALATVSSSRTAGTVARRNTVTAGTAQTATATQSATTSVGVANPVRVVTTNGRVTVTNATATTGTTAGVTAGTATGRQQ
jgi:hypothetical protein